MSAERRTTRQTAAAVRRRLRLLVSRDVSTPQPAAVSYELLRAAVYGKPPRAGYAKVPKGSDVATHLQEVTLLRARAKLAESLASGRPATQAWVDTTRALAARRRYAEAERLAAAGKLVPGLEEGARIGSAIIALRRGRQDLAAIELAGVSRESALEHAPAELMGTELATDRRTGLATAEDILHRGKASQPDAVWLDLARQAFGNQEPELSSRFLGQLSPKSSGPDSEAAFLAGWIERALSDRTPSPTPEGQVSFALLDYKQPDMKHQSANVGDYVQTLASMSNLVRHQDLVFAGDPELATLATELQGRVQPGLRLSGVSRTVNLLTVNRDAMSLDTIPEGTWALAFGWYMHDWFKVHWDFPLHPNLRPIFISFHINKERILTPEGIASLKAAAPIGCRDWTTVHLLAKHGIPAFFSGCMTTTVSAVFPAQPTAAAHAPTAFVDLLPRNEPPSTGSIVRITHSDPVVRRTPFVPNMRRAIDMLDTYRTDVADVVTSRLHCYLPVRSLGVSVDFRPKDPADIRFDGLSGIDDEAFAKMQDGIRSKVAAVITEIMCGSDEATVRKVWTEVCADDVAYAATKTG